MALVSLATAKQHLHKDPPAGSPLSADDEDVQRILLQATAMVVNFLTGHGRPPDEDWNEDDTDPAEDTDFAITTAAILDVLGNLYSHRGDDDPTASGPITARVTQILLSICDPVLR